MGSSSECSFISRGSENDGYTVDVAIKNCKVNGIVYGLSGVKQIYSLKLTMQDIDSGRTEGKHLNSRHEWSS